MPLVIHLVNQESHRAGVGNRGAEGAAQAVDKEQDPEWKVPERRDHLHLIHIPPRVGDEERAGRVVQEDSGRCQLRVYPKPVHMLPQVRGRQEVVELSRYFEVKKVPTRTGACCTPSTISCHSYGLASHQVLHDLALSCTISHKKIEKYGSFTQLLIPCNTQLPSTIQIQSIHTEGFQGCLRSRVDTQQFLSTRRSSHGAHGDTGVGRVQRIAPKRKP